MSSHLQPTPASINLDPDLVDDFWYWRGASGRRYIHSVYVAEACPVLPQAVYLSVKRLAGNRFAALSIEVADAVGLLANRYVACTGADEVHVHLLAPGMREARVICDDLKAGVFGTAGAVEAGATMLPAERQCALPGETARYTPA